MNIDYTINYPTIDEGDDYDEQNILGTPCQLGPSHWMPKNQFLAAFHVDKAGIHHSNYFSIFLFPDTKTNLFLLLTCSSNSSFKFFVWLKKNILVQRGYGRRNQWQITIHDGLPSLVKPWFQYLSENNLMPGDEVVFFFRFDEHTWEVLFRKEVIGMTPFPVEDHPT
ncbi:hypothetical protein GmHk_19G054651 [Glycine max]|nr:hypothetical protein GmHk_19G054651 [Glycine max]